MVATGVQIGSASQISGASVRSLRFYEDEGLITPGRLANGYRDYCPSTITTVLQIRSLLESGLPLRLVREALPHLEGTRSGTWCPEFLEEVTRHRDRLVGQISGLEQQRSAIDAFLRAARSTSPP